MATQAKNKPHGAVKASPKLTRDPKMRSQAIEALGKMGVAKTEAAEHVDAVHGDRVEDVVANAFRRRQALKEGKTPPPMATGPTMPPTPPPAPIAQSSAPQLGLPPGGSQAAPSAQQLQAQGPVPRPALSAVERLTPGQGIGARSLPPINFGLLPRGPQPVPQPAAAIPPAAPVQQLTVTAPAQQVTPPVAPIEGGEQTGPVRWRLKQTKTPAAKEPEFEERPPTVRSQDEVDKLKSGDKFIWGPDGWIYTKH